MATIGKYQLKSGAVRYRVRYHSDVSRRTSGVSTAREAKAFAAAVEVDIAKGAHVRVRDGRVSVGELGRPFLDRRRGPMKPSAWRVLELSCSTASRTALGRSADQ